MELPVDKNFAVSAPNLDSLLLKSEQPDAQQIYNLALGIKPQIRNAELNRESAGLNVQIAKADYLPSLMLGAGLSTGYASYSNSSDYRSQVWNKMSPSLGLTLSIPLFQKNQVKTNVSLARIAVSNAELDEVNTKNGLRKEIEQACADFEKAKSEYAAATELMQSSKESYDVTDEKFKVGLLNSVDFLVQKTNLITSESKFLQSKFNMIFGYKVIDFYKGIPLVL
jgi:outer membrane protein